LTQEQLGNAVGRIFRKKVNLYRGVDGEKKREVSTYLYKKDKKERCLVGGGEKNGERDSGWEGEAGSGRNIKERFLGGVLVEKKKTTPGEKTL